jgi:hypothetical protein
MPMSDCFEVLVMWHITPLNNTNKEAPEIQVIIELDFKYLQYTWFQSLIESNTKSELLEVYDHWLVAANQFIETDSATADDNNINNNIKTENPISDSVEEFCRAEENKDQNSEDKSIENTPLELDTDEDVDTPPTETISEEAEDPDVERISDTAPEDFFDNATGDGPETLGTGTETNIEDEFLRIHQKLKSLQLENLFLKPFRELYSLNQMIVQQIVVEQMRLRNQMFETETETEEEIIGEAIVMTPSRIAAAAAAAASLSSSSSSPPLSSNITGTSIAEADTMKQDDVVKAPIAEAVIEQDEVIYKNEVRKFYHFERKRTSSAPSTPTQAFKSTVATPQAPSKLSPSLPSTSSSITTSHTDEQAQPVPPVNTNINRRKSNRLEKLPIAGLFSIDLDNLIIPFMLAIAILLLMQGVYRFVFA